MIRSILPFSIISLFEISIEKLVLNTKICELRLASERVSGVEDRCVYLLGQIEAIENSFSVLDYIEPHDELLGSKYLAFLHEIGKLYMEIAT
jgi:hypothetical protein